jgi:hypothetical protein
MSVIKKLNINYSLSNIDISKLLNNKCKIITYQELTKYNNIEILLKEKKFIILLYESTRNYGHWCTFFINKDNNIEFFDSYGIMPDFELKFSDNIFRKHNNMLLPHLTVLLINSKRDIEYNNYKLQGEKTQTCGLWCVFRCLTSKNKNIDDFYDLFKNVKNKDKLLIKIFKS